jgi:hypothetical protein
MEIYISNESLIGDGMGDPPHYAFFVITVRWTAEVHDAGVRLHRTAVVRRALPGERWPVTYTFFYPEEKHRSISGGWSEEDLEG